MTATAAARQTNGEGPSVVSRPEEAQTMDHVDVASLLERGRTLCTPVLREAVARLAPPMDMVSAYHFGWTDADGKPTEGDGGKAVRPKW
jgi:geranylgeranyl diphosphate synthase type I